jgi:hypothetical protein
MFCAGWSRLGDADPGPPGGPGGGLLAGGDHRSDQHHRPSVLPGHRGARQPRPRTPGCPADPCCVDRLPHGAAGCA